MKIEVGVLYEAEDGTFGLCTQSDGEVFGLAFVAEETGRTGRMPMTYRIYKVDGTNDGVPNIVKELWRLHQQGGVDG